MRTISVHHADWARSHSIYEHIKERVLVQVTALYHKIKSVAETEDIVVILWLVMLVSLSYISYVRFSECGKILGLYTRCCF